MNRSFLNASAIALTACLAASFVPLAASAASPRAPEFDVKVDPQILSGAPFVFRADRGIFSPMTDEPADSRIFKQRKPALRTGDMRISDVHAAHFEATAQV